MSGCAAAYVSGLNKVSLAGFLLLTLIVIAGATYRNSKGRFNLLLLVAAFIFGYTIEVLGVSSGAYCYGFSFWMLPGQVPLYIPCGWAIIFYASFQNALNYTENPTQIGVLTAIPAVLIDLLLDPGSVGLGLWEWKNSPRLWFGVPYSNFFGWGLVVASLAYAMHTTAVKPAQRIMKWSLTSRTLVGFIFAYVICGAGFALYQLIRLAISNLPSTPLLLTLVHALVFLAALRVCLRTLVDKPAVRRPQLWLIVVPAYLSACALLFNVQFQPTTMISPLLFITPPLLCLLGFFFLRPYVRC